LASLSSSQTQTAQACSEPPTATTSVNDAESLSALLTRWALLYLFFIWQDISFLCVSCRDDSDED
jgi:hypothetical protein